MYGPKKIALFLPFFLVLSFLPPSVFALAGTWAGYVFNETATFNASYLTPNSLPVGVFVNGASTQTYNVSIGYGGFSGYYIVDVDEAGVSTITFKVCGVNVTQGTQTFSIGPHPTGASPYFNLTWNRSADGAACTYACGCTGGYCNSGVCANSAPSGGGTTTGGGTTGGGTSETTTTVTTTTSTTTTTIVEQETVASITPATPATITLTQPNLAIEEIRVEVNNAVSNVQITVTQTSAAPSAASSAPLVISSSVGSIYKFIEISKTNIQDADIAKTKISFKVEKSWINAEGINPDTIAMNKLENNAWNKLPTVRLSEEDSNYIYYEVELTSLSVFAVTGEKVVATTTTSSTTTTTRPTTTTTTPFQLPPIDWKWIVLAIVIVVIAAAVIHLLENKESALPWQR